MARVGFHLDARRAATAAAEAHVPDLYLVLFAALRTPLLGRIVREPIGELQEASRKAVAFRLLRDRRQALHTLSHNGVHVVDVEPTHLTAPLINRFIELRQRNLL